MSDLVKRIAALSPQQRALLELRLKQKEAKTTVNHIPRRTTSEALPLSLAQERLWFLHQLQPDIPLYNETSLLRLRGQLNISALEKSLSTLIARHESLRSRFPMVGDSPIQVIEKPQPFRLQVIPVDSLPTAQVKEIIQAESSLPFNLTQGNLLRGTLFQVQPQEFFLLLTMHHIISDGWSWKVFYQELATLYTAYSQGKTPLLPDLPIQYADFAIWQRQWLQTNPLQSQLEYWQKQLAPTPALLNLPTDYPRCAMQRFRGAREPLMFSQSLNQAIKTLSQQSGTTPFMTLLAAWMTLLYRYTGQTDITVGTPIANRDRPEIEGLIGCFINTLVLRGQLSPECSFQQLLEQIREITLSAYSHSDLPFEDLVKQLKPERVMSHTPLFQVMFVYQDAPSQALELPYLTLEPLVPENGISKFDLTLFMEDTPHGLMGALEYNTDLFKPETIQRLLGHFHTLLQGIVNNPHQSLATLSLLTANEQQQLHDWNLTAIDYPQNVCLHTLIEAQVEKTPEAIALVLDESHLCLSYQELNTKANQLAHHLQKIGVQPDTLVGVCLERSAEMVIALLAILKAGGAYVPLEPTYPPQRLALMIKDADLPLILTQQQWQDQLSSTTAQIICLDSLEWVNACSENPMSSVTAESLAYTIYTSGSTGTPKGVMNTHKGIVNRLLWMKDHYGITSEDCCLQKTPFSFDVSVWEFFLPLMVGAKLVIARPEGHKEPKYLQDIINRQGITLIHFVPSMLQVFLNTVEKDQLPSLQRVICSGEALSVNLQNAFLKAFPQIKLHNLYGPTEAAIDVTAWECRYEANQQIVPIGKAIANTQLYILDSHLQVVPVGVPGELHIGGVGLARGYLNRPELTPQRFITNPFNSDSRLYKTGDLCRYRDDRAIEFLGRLDHQVKIRGFRIELGEIESLLTQYSQVRKAVVVARQEDPNNAYLVAYIVPQHSEISVQDLRQFLQKQLPDYMIPGVFMQLPDLPLNANGKVDRKALPIPNSTRIIEKTFVAPRTPIEAILGNIWGRILKLNSVSVEGNFFELGGHSLLATQVMSQLRQAFSLEFPLRSLFENPTIAELARQVEQSLTGQPLEDSQIKPVSRNSLIPLSFSQQRLWFLHELDSHTAAYNGCVAVNFQGNLNIFALEQSLNGVIARHEILRTQFNVVNGQPIQEILPQFKLVLPIIDLRQIPVSEQAEKAQELAIAEAQKPFILSHAPFLRVSLLQFGEQNYRLIFTIHHIIFDAWSAGILIREMAVIYESLMQNQTAILPPMTIQYADFAVWQREWLQGEVLQQQLNYWKAQLTPTPPVLKLPTASEIPGNDAGTRYYFHLSKSLSDALSCLSQAQGTTLFMTLLAGFKILLHYYTQQTDITVGSPIANRRRREIEGLIGFFVNTLVLRTNLSQPETFADVLQQIREVTLGAYTHQDLPFEKLVGELQLNRNLDSFPLFRVWFVLQNTPTEALKLPELTLSLSDLETGFVRHDLKLDLTETAEGIQGFFEYKTALFDRGFISGMAELLKTLLTVIVEQPEISWRSLLEKLAASEKQQQLATVEAVKSSRREKLGQMRRRKINS